uniref:Monocarboxylate transporter n=1 Tax=Echinococcus canadensis TaxID=519352 RepID=A0A915EYG5_9CEST
MTLILTYAPVPSYLTSISSGGANVDALIFSTTAGRVFAAICFFLGITDGAFMTLLGPMLEYLLDDTNFPAGLGISLCIMGAFNLAGTLIGGHLLDASGTYYSANLMAACLPLTGFLILIKDFRVDVFINRCSEWAKERRMKYACAWRLGDVRVRRLRVSVFGKFA